MDSTGCDTACVWAGYNQSACTGPGFSAFQQLISHYGVTKDGKGTATAGTAGKAAAAPTIPIIHCPCKHIWIGFAGMTKGTSGPSSTSQHVEFKVQIVGISGYVDDKDYWIPNKPNTEKLQLWCTNPAGKTWLMLEFWPGKDGHFAINIGSDTAEARKYSVCWGGTTPKGYPTKYPTL